MDQELMKPTIIHIIVVVTALALGASACGTGGAAPTDQIPVVATTSILADVVSRVGGDLIAVTPLVPPGANEHAYQPSPRDIAAVTDAALVFEVGLGLEEFMLTIIDNAGTSIDPVFVSEGIATKEFSGNGDEHYTADPHVWMDPANVIIWARNIAAALSAYDPAHRDAYEANSAAYITELEALDAWISTEVGKIPLENRQLVTDHMLFGYFAEKYGFSMVGAIIPSYSSGAEPSAMELAELEDAIREYNVKAILVGNTVNPALAKRIAEDTGTLLVEFYTGSLSEPGGPAGTYIEYMRYNVNAIVSALD
jgi:ABC-type Zn uptake system ZnuABC Zn-binding protein ZnuA